MSGGTEDPLTIIALGIIGAALVLGLAFLLYLSTRKKPDRFHGRKQHSNQGSNRNREEKETERNLNIKEKN